MALFVINICVLWLIYSCLIGLRKSWIERINHDKVCFFRKIINSCLCYGQREAVVHWVKAGCECKNSQVIFRGLSKSHQGNARMDKFIIIKQRRLKSQKQEILKQRVCLNQLFSSVARALNPNGGHFKDWLSPLKHLLSKIKKSHKKQESLMLT